MKKIFKIIAVSIFVCQSLYAFVDRQDRDREEMQNRLNELRVIKGVFLSGRTFIYLDPIWGNGNAFTNLAKKNDFNPLFNLYMNITAFPMPALEIGTRLSLSMSQKVYYNLIADNLYAEFIALQFILIRFGQISEKFTPFTLWSETDRVWLRSELFQMYQTEDLVYRLMDTDHSVPMQGIKIKFDLAMGEDGLIRFKTFGAKILDESAQYNSYDRYLIGVMPGLSLFSDSIVLDGVYISCFDNTNSGSKDYNPPKKYEIASVSGSINGSGFVPFFQNINLTGLGIEGEFALSRHVEDLFLDNKPENGIAWKANLFAKIEKMLDLKAGYRQIAYEFVSPGAQTRFITPFVSGSIFRNAEYYDYLGLKPFYFMNIYRNRIQFTRDNNDLLNFTYSMNEATPNREGLFGKLNVNLFDYVLLSVDASTMNEVAPVASPNKNLRDFLRIESEGSIKLNTIFDTSTFPKISGFYVLENNNRDDDPLTTGSEKEDLVTSIIGAEILFDFKFVKIVGMYQRANLKGTKFIDVYDYKNQNALTIEGYSPVSLDLVNTLIGGGAVIRISQNVNMQLDSMYMAYKDNNDSASDYTFIQGRSIIVAKF